jgi:hypothetical protein
MSKLYDSHPEISTLSNILRVKDSSTNNLEEFSSKYLEMIMMVSRSKSNGDNIILTLWRFMKELHVGLLCFVTAITFLARPLKP